MDVKPRKLLLGELLVEEGVITKQLLDKALAIQKTTKDKLGKIIIDKGFAAADVVYDTLSRKFSIPYLKSIDQMPEDGNREIRSLIDYETASKNSLFPISLERNTLTVALSDPNNLELLSSLEFRTGKSVKPVFAKPSSIFDAINKFYGSTLYDTSRKDPSDVTKLKYNEIDFRSFDKTQSQAGKPESIKLFDQILMESINQKATEIHVDPWPTFATLRVRIDRTLQTRGRISLDDYHQVNQRIKAISLMNINEKKLPQDGRFTIFLADRNVDMRVNAFPTLFGEKFLIRIIDTERFTGNLGTIGLSAKMLEAFRRQITKNMGMIIIGGPANGGKSTTISAIMKELDGIGKLIMSVEESVHNPIENVVQTEVDPKSNFYLEDALTSAIKMGPDILFVERIEDKSVAELAMNSAVSGSLVISTLNTPDSIATINRLAGMGIDPFLISSSINSVIAQQLVRKICPKCKTEYAPDSQLIESAGLDSSKNYKFYRGAGCAACNSTGYLGMIGIFELLVIDQNFRSLIASKTSDRELRIAAHKMGFETIRYDVLSKVVAGYTTLDEVLRVF